MAGKRYTFDPVSMFHRNGGHGNFLVLKGPIRKGKSYLTGILARELITQGFKVITNQMFTLEARNDYAGKLFYINNAKGFLEVYVNNTGPFVALFDDAQTYGFSSTSATSKKGRTIADLMLFVGKLEMSCIFNTHLKYIPEAILAMEPVFYYKLDRPAFFLPKPATRLITEVRDVRSQSIRISIPQHWRPIPYRTTAVPSFDINIPLEKLWSFLGEWEKDHDNMRLGVKTWLEELDNTDPMDDLKKLTWKDIWMAIQIKKPGVKPGTKLYNLIPQKVIYGSGEDD